MSEDLVGRARTQGVYLAAGQAATRAVQFLSTVVLARLLVPDQFGTVAIAAVVWEIVALFGNTGVAATIIHRRDPIEDLCQAAFWLNGTVAAVVAAISIGAAYGAALLYGEPRIVPILGLFAASFLIGSAGTIHAVLMTREVAFGRLALVEAACAAASAAASILLAAAGAGIWSLVAPAPGVALLRVALLWRLHPWRPRSAARVGLWRGIFGYGRWVLGADLVGYVNLNGDYMIAGKALGEHALGIYSMGFRAANWPVEAGIWIVSRIAFPTLSSVQETPDRLAELFTKMLRAVAVIAFPAVAVLFVASPDMVGLLYGAEKWGTSAPLIQILLPCVALRALASPASQALLALGRARDLFLFGLTVTPFLLGSVLFGTRFGLTGVAVATSAVLGIASAALTSVSCRAAGVRICSVLASLLPGVVAGGAALAGSVLAFAGVSVLIPLLPGFLAAAAPSGLLSPGGFLQPPASGAAGVQAIRLGLTAAAGILASWLVVRLAFAEEYRLLAGGPGEGVVATLRRGLGRIAGTPQR